MYDASKPQANFIAGEWVSSRKLLDNIDPATGAVFAQVSLASVADVDLARYKGTRLLTTSFQPGDYLIFGMFTAHAAFDNSSTSGRVRVSCDMRFHPARDVMDERFSGPNPPTNGGLGYGCLSAARPMTEAQTLR